MKFKLDFIELEALRDQMEEMVEAIAEFQEHYTNLKTVLEDSTSGESFEKLKDMTETNADDLKSVAEQIEEKRVQLDGYLEGIRNINLDHPNVYMLDTHDVWWVLDGLQKEFKNNYDIPNTDWKLDSFMDDYERNIQKFEDVDSSIDIESEYEDDEDTQSYIRQRRVEISSLINNYKANRDFSLEEAIEQLKLLQGYMEEDTDILEDYKKILTDLEEFEETYNPGFWDKHGQQIKFILTVVGMFVGEPIAAIIAGMEMAIAIGEGEGILGAALAFVPGDKALGALGDVAKKADGKLADAAKKGFSKMDELTPGCFRCMIGA